MLIEFLKGFYIVLYIKFVGKNGDQVDFINIVVDWLNNKVKIVFLKNEWDIVFIVQV